MPSSKSHVKIAQTYSSCIFFPFIFYATLHAVPVPVISLHVNPFPTIIIYGLVITWGPPSGSNFPTHVTIYISIDKNIIYCFVYAAPGPVTALSVTSHPTNISLIVTWQPPRDPDRLPVEGYKVQYRQLPNEEWNEAVITSAQTNQYILSGLKPATTYEVQVWAFSTSGADPLNKRTDSETTGGREWLLL